MKPALYHVTHYHTLSYTSRHRTLSSGAGVVTTHRHEKGGLDFRVVRCPAQGHRPGKQWSHNANGSKYRALLSLQPGAASQQLWPPRGRFNAYKENALFYSCKGCSLGALRRGELASRTPGLCHQGTSGLPSLGCASPENRHQESCSQHGVKTHVAPSRNRLHKHGPPKPRNTRQRLFRMS